eukprot:699776-Rhodomonas_salina.1
MSVTLGMVVLSSPSRRMKDWRLSCLKSRQVASGQVTRECDGNGELTCTGQDGPSLSKDFTEVKERWMGTCSSTFRSEQAQHKYVNQFVHGKIDNPPAACFVRMHGVEGKSFPCCRDARLEGGCECDQNTIGNSM